MLKYILLSVFSLCYINSVSSQCFEGFDHIEWSIETVNNPTDAVIDASDPDAISLTGNNNGQNHTQVNYCYTIPANGTLSFSWVYASTNGFAGFDPSGYMINNEFTQITDGEYDTFNGDVDQNGVAEIEVNAGDIFCFSQRSSDGNFGAATTTFSNLKICPAEPIPTLGEWGLICLSLSLIIIGVVSIKERELQFG